MTSCYNVIGRRRRQMLICICKHRLIGRWLADWGKCYRIPAQGVFRCSVILWLLLYWWQYLIKFAYDVSFIVLTTVTEHIHLVWLLLECDMDAYATGDSEVPLRSFCSLDNSDDSSSWCDLSSLLRLLRSCAVENAEYFSSGAAAGSAWERLYTSCSQMIGHLDGGVVTGVYALLQASPLFDYSRQQPGNGYRSFVTVVHKCCLHLLTLVRYIRVNRESYLFRAEHYSRELEAYVTVLGQLRACLYYLQKLVLFCMDGSLFPDENTLSPEEYHTAEYLMKDFESLCQEAFYGRCLGFQVQCSHLEYLL